MARIRPLHVLILGGLSAIGPLSTDMYLPALPALGRDFGAAMAQTQLTLSAGILGLALGQVIGGPISDALGRRRPLLVGILAYVLASVLLLFAPSLAVLTGLRFVQGLAGATGIVIALAMARDLYSGVALARFLSLLMLVSGVAPILAPVIGSQLLAFTSWRGIFAVLALGGVVLLLATARGMGETLPPQLRQGGGIGASLGAFRALLADRRFIGYALTSGFSFAVGITYISVAPFILQNIYGVSPQLVGLVFAVNAIGLVLLAQVNGRLVGRVAPARLLGWGVASLALGALAMLAVVLGGVGLIGVLAALFVMIASLGLIAPNATTLALSDTRAAGSAAALLGVLQLTIGAVAAPLVGLGGTTSAVPLALALVLFAGATLLTLLIVGRASAARA